MNAIRLGSRALASLVRGDVRGALRGLRAVEWGLLIPLLAGILGAVAALSGILERLLEDQPVPMAGLFLGLVAGSTVIAWPLLAVRDARRLALLAGSAVATFVLLGIREGTSDDTVGQLDDASSLAYFGAGAVAICAMILPGISGSFLLVTMGMYGAVLGAVNDRDLVVVGVFTLGCVVGLGLFSQVLHWALAEHEATVMAVLIGLMAGSLRVLWPWPAGVDSTGLGAPDTQVPLTFLLAVVGLVVVVVMQRIGARVEHRLQAEDLAV